jgi:ABC-type uncharacterized transport system
MGSKPKTTTPDTPDTPDTQAVRRIKFGLNITLQVVAALGVVIFANWIASRQYLRLDLTQDRSYSLSAQSKAVLGKLDGGFRIVTLLTEANSDQASLVHRRIRDLSDEYARYAENVTVKHLDVRGDIAETEQLFGLITQAFDDELAPAIEAINLGKAALDQIVPFNTELSALLMSGLKTDPGDDEESPAQALYRAAATSCQAIDKTIEQVDQQTDDLMDQVLVNYAGIKEQVQAVLTDYNTVLGVIADRSRQMAGGAGVDNDDKERFLHVAELCKQGQDRLAAPLKQMDAAKPLPRYNQVLYDFVSGASVVVLSEDRVKVVPVSEMWRQDTRGYEETGRAQPQYLIEEKLTGAMLSMTLEQPPMVVFVTSGGGPALGERGQYNIVAQRLQNADFAVTQWNPAGQMSSMGQPTPPMPRPQAKPGQKTIWIVLPTPGSQMNNPMMMMANPRQKIADLLQERLDQGDAALILLAVDPAASVGIANPITDWLSGWGLTPQLDRLVLEEVQQDNRRTATTAQFIVDAWPDSLPITTALNGMQANFSVASPILIGDTDNTTQHPLVQIKGKRLWAHSDLSSPQAVQESKFSEPDSAPSFTIAVASVREGKRLVTTTEYLWPNDAVTGYGLLGPGTADLTGAAFPANSELFVNSVFWLAGLEDLIAASPRAQDVPRINPMSAEAMGWYQTALLVGMPGAVVLSGLGVWWVRRRA